MNNGWVRNSTEGPAFGKLSQFTALSFEEAFSL
jgi:hypothetical protein